MTNQKVIRFGFDSHWKKNFGLILIYTKNQLMFLNPIIRSNLGQTEAPWYRQWVIRFCFGLKILWVLYCCHKFVTSSSLIGSCIVVRSLSQVHHRLGQNF